MVTWYLLLIALCLGQGHETAQLEQLECFNDYIQEVTCSWHGTPDTNCSTDCVLYYRNSSSELYNITDIVDLPEVVCQGKFKEQILLFMTKHKINVYCKRHLNLSKDINSSQTIKPLAPYNLSVDTSQGKEAFLIWADRYIDGNIDSSLEYQVACMKKGGNWKKFLDTGQRKMVLMTLLEPGYTYHLTVRSRPTHPYNGVWSEWSPECQWSYDSSNWISHIVIVLVCIFIPLPIALCFYGFQRVKKSWWEKIPSPLKSSVSKQTFNKPQVNGCVFSESKIDDCKVEKISCITEIPWGKSKVGETAAEPLGTESAFQHLMSDTRADEMNPFPHFPGFGFPVLSDLSSLFPLPGEDLSLVSSDAPGYSLFNGVAKDQWAEEGDGYRPFTDNQGGGRPLTLPTYSLSPAPGSEASGSAGYQPFSSSVSKSWAESEWDLGKRWSSDALLPPLSPCSVESSEYMASGNQTSPSLDQCAAYNFTLAFGHDFLLHPFPLTPRDSPFLLNVPGKRECQEPPAIHWGPGLSLNLLPPPHPPGKVT
ncbi:uncharacterized protein LOC144604246 [Rhinoraja longicauda]